MKMLFIGRRRGGLTLAQLHEHMLYRHSDLVLEMMERHPEFAPDRYHENHVFEQTYSDVEGDTLGRNRDFVTEVWTRDPGVLQQLRDVPFYRDVVCPDELFFADMSVHAKFPVAEHIVMPHRGGTADIRLIMLLQKLASTDEAVFRSRWQEASRGLASLPSAPQVVEHHQNEPMPWPSPRAPMAALELLRFRDPEQALGFAREAASHFESTLAEGPQAVMPARSLVCLFARSYLCHDGQRGYRLATR